MRKLEEIPEEEHDNVLCQFYAEIRKQNGDEYKPNSLTVIQGSLDCHLKNNSKSLEFFSSNYLQIGQHVVLLHTVY